MRVGGSRSPGLASCLSASNVHSHTVGFCVLLSCPGRRPSLNVGTQRLPPGRSGEVQV